MSVTSLSDDVDDKVEKEFHALGYSWGDAGTNPTVALAQVSEVGSSFYPLLKLQAKTSFFLIGTSGDSLIAARYNNDGTYNDRTTIL